MAEHSNANVLGVAVGLLAIIGGALSIGLYVGNLNGVSDAESKAFDELSRTVTTTNDTLLEIQVSLAEIAATREFEKTNQQMKFDKIQEELDTVKSEIAATRSSVRGLQNSVGRIRNIVEGKEDGH